MVDLPGNDVVTTAKVGLEERLVFGISEIAPACEVGVAGEVVRPHIEMPLVVVEPPTGKQVLDGAEVNHERAFRGAGVCRGHLQLLDGSDAGSSADRVGAMTPNLAFTRPAISASASRVRATWSIWDMNPWQTPG